MNKYPVWQIYKWDDNNNIYQNMGFPQGGKTLQSLYQYLYDQLNTDPLLAYRTITNRPHYRSITYNNQVGLDLLFFTTLPMPNFNYDLDKIIRHPKIYNSISWTGRND